MTEVFERPLSGMPDIRPARDEKPTKVVFEGGCVTSRHPSVVAPGFSMVQNMRQKFPGHQKRAGQAYLHATADGTNRPITIFQFTDKAANSHFIAQMSDGDYLIAGETPPTVAAGVFGTELFGGTASPRPSSYAVVDDMLFFSNGVDQHQVWVGEQRPVKSCIVVKDTGALPAVPDTGEDYSLQARDGRSTTVVVLDSLDTYANGDCLLLRTDVPKVKQFNFTVSAVNGTAATLALYKWNGSWTSVAITDGTADGGATLAKTGAVTFTAPTDVIPKYAFGVSGFWWRFEVSAAIDAEVEVSAISYESDPQDVFNLWDSVPLPAIEVMVYDGAAYSTYSYDSVTVSEIESTYKVYFRTRHLIEAFYVDVGGTPNTNASTTVDGFAYWTGTAFSEAAPTSDGTSGLSKSGWVITGRKAAQKTQFENTEGYGYWWYFTIYNTLSADLSISIETMPYFDITDFGNIGNVCCGWKGRLALTFNLWPKDVYVSLKNLPFCFNDSTNSGESPILQPGDGRPNEVTCMLSFYNEIVIFQKEQDTKGGCVTLYQGDSGPEWGATILSTNLGTFNAKSGIVVEGAFTSVNTTTPVATLIVFISREGVFTCNGNAFERVSGDIDNYFDPSESECIRRGYELEHWIGFDSSVGVIRAGIVSGTSATVPNIFPVFTIGDKSGHPWAFDSIAQALSCFAQISAGTGDIPIIQVGGAAGYVMRLNTGTNDVAAAIDAYSTLELGGADDVSLHGGSLRTVVQSAGNVTVTPYKNGVAKTAVTVPMTALYSNELVRKAPINISNLDSHLSLKFQNATASQSIHLLDALLNLKFQNATESQSIHLLDALLNLEDAG